MAGRVHGRRRSRRPVPDLAIDLGQYYLLDLLIYRDQFLIFPF